MRAHLPISISRRGALQVFTSRSVACAYVPGEPIGPPGACVALAACRFRRRRRAPVRPCRPSRRAVRALDPGRSLLVDCSGAPTPWLGFVCPAAVLTGLLGVVPMPHPAWTDRSVSIVGVPVRHLRARLSQPREDQDREVS
jgi:hypothetical protein